MNGMAKRFFFLVLAISLGSSAACNILDRSEEKVVIVVGERNITTEEGPPQRFPRNVPLPQMIDILVDLWEAEGLDV